MALQSQSSELKIMGFYHKLTLMRKLLTLRAFKKKFKAPPGVHLTLCLGDQQTQLTELHLLIHSKCCYLAQLK